jgi:hypothetical protein
MVCYKGGLAVQENFQMCDVTSMSRSTHTMSQVADTRLDRKIIDTIPDGKLPQVTFSCSASPPSTNTTSLTSGSHPLLSTFGIPDLSTSLEDAEGVCTFQFWVDREESFYCNLDGCSWQSRDNSNRNGTNYHCERIECTCVPGRFLCGRGDSIGESTILLVLES